MCKYQQKGANDRFTFHWKVWVLSKHHPITSNPGLIHTILTPHPPPPRWPKMETFYSWSEGTCAGSSLCFLAHCLFLLPPRSPSSVTLWGSLMSSWESPSWLLEPVCPTAWPALSWPDKVGSPGTVKIGKEGRKEGFSAWWGLPHVARKGAADPS